MPNSRTFNIKAISSIIEKYAHGCIIDPFANNSRIATITNDIDTQFETTYHMDAIDFLNMFAPNSIDTVLYDPPYSPRQVSECYKKLGITVICKLLRLHIGVNKKKLLAELLKKMV